MTIYDELGRLSKAELYDLFSKIGDEWTSRGLSTLVAGLANGYHGRTHTSGKQDSDTPQIFRELADITHHLGRLAHHENMNGGNNINLNLF